MKFEIELPSKPIIAARLYQAKNHTRICFDGIQLNSEGFVHGTNGQILYRAEVEELKQLEESVIIDISGTIPKKASRLILIFDTDSDIGLIKAVCSKRNVLSVLSFKTIDSDYPDIEKILPNHELEPVETVALNADYISIASKTAQIFSSFKTLKLSHTKSRLLQVRFDDNLFNSMALFMPLLN